MDESYDIDSFHILYVVLQAGQMCLRYFLKNNAIEEPLG